MGLPELISKFLQSKIANASNTFTKTAGLIKRAACCHLRAKTKHISRTNVVGGKMELEAAARSFLSTLSRLRIEQQYRVSTRFVLTGIEIS
jgi:hypothetical protein